MGFGRGLTERLGLDEAQQPQVQALVDQMHQNAAPSREQMGELFEQERALWTAGQVDTRALGEINDRMDALMSAERERQVDFRLALIQLLTPEQRARLAEMPLAGGPRGMGHGPGRGMGRGMGPGYGAGHGPGADPGRE
jgi:Spy/CpxP family protein refolding chaperone